MHFAGNRGAGERDPVCIHERARVALATAWQSGYRFFDHADIYGGGESERMFARVAAELGLARSDYTLQTKCGIRPGNADRPTRYDFGKDYILAAVDGSLARLGMDYIDILLLHRPDVLMEPEQVAEAFTLLQQSGKVRAFGVSNFTPAQMQWLQSVLQVPLVANQVELNLFQTSLLDCGIVSDARTRTAAAGHPADGTLEYCRLHKMVIQAWAPLAYGYATGRPHPSAEARYQQTSALVAQLARVYGVSAEAIITAWLLRIPGPVQPIIGTRDPDRIAGCAQAHSLNLSHEHWYQLYVTGRGYALP